MARKKHHVTSLKPKIRTKRSVPTTPLIDFPHLPAEVRVKIYELRFAGAILCIVDDGIDLKQSRARGEIARASKEIYSESMPILYQMATVKYSGDKKGPAQLNLIPQYQKYITRIVLQTKTAVSLVPRNLKAYVALDVLRINVQTLFLFVPYLGSRTVRPEDFESTPGRYDAKLLLDIIEAIKPEHPRSMVYPVSKGPLKYDDLNKLMSIKGRKFKIQVTVNLHIYMEFESSVFMGSLHSFEKAVANISKSVLIDWESKTIISKTCSSRTQF